MIKDIILNVSRSYNPYVPVSEIWGAGQTVAGELDNDFNARKFLPVDNGTNWEIVTQTGNNTSLAIKTDGTLWTWGNNSIGALGQNNTVNRSSPVQVGNNTWVSASAGGSTTSYFHAIRSDGTLWTWGLNSSGQLGLGDIVNRSSPIQLGTRIWKNIFGSGDSHTIAVRSDDTVWGWGGSSGEQFGNEEVAGAFGIIDNASGPWNDVAPNRSYTIAVKSDGGLYGWGLNTSGQLGTGDTVYRSSPVQITNINTWVSASNNAVRTMAIMNDGTLWGWGDNTSGRLGNAGDRSAPNYVRPVQVWTDAKIADKSGILIKNDGTLWTFGENQYGQLGLGNTVNRSSPVQVGTRTWTQISPGGIHMLAIRSDGTLWSWGANSNRFGQTTGALGDGTTTNKSSPVQIGTETNWAYVDAGVVGSSFAIKTNGTLWAWGRNTTGHLGLGDLINRSSPVQVGTLNNWSQVIIGFENVHALKTDGTLWGWGQNTEGQLGNNSTVSTSSPVQLGTNTWSSIAFSDGDNGGYSQTMAIRSDGTLWKWGSNLVGEMGINLTGATERRSSPVQIGTETNWASGGIGGYSVWAIKTNGTLWAWGSNTRGILGLGSNTLSTYSSPVQVGTETNWVSASLGNQEGILLKNNGYALTTGLSNFGYEVADLTSVNRSSPVQIGFLNNWKDVSVGPSHTIAIKTDGTIWGWGDNTNGQIANNVFSLLPASPDLVWVSGSTNTTSLALKTNGTMWGWGDNTNGTVGDNTTVTRSSPVQLGTNTWKKIQTGGFANHAIRNDDTLWAWGRQITGEMPFNDTITRSSPVQVGTLTWKDVSLAHNHVIAIRTDGTLWSWGNNSAGAAGTNSTITRSSPVQIGTETNWANIATGNSISIATKTDGTLWSWGLNTSGQLGLGNAVSRSSPVQIGTETNWAYPYAGSSYAFARKTNGTLWVWGANSNGNLGLGDGISRSSPVQIGTQTNWKDVFIGNPSANTTIATKTDGTLWAWGGTAVNNEDRRTGGSAFSSPVQVGTKTDWNTAAVGQAGLGPVVFAINSSGELYSGPGINVSIALWNSSSMSSPVQIGTETNWASVSAQHSLYSTALKNDGTLWTWGYNFYGLNTNYVNGVSLSEPKQSTSDTWSKFVTAKESTTSVYAWGGIKPNGTLWMWGLNNYGLIGDNSSGNIRSSPVQIGTRTWTDLDIGQDYTMAIRSDGTLWGWGRNDRSQLGLRDTIARSSPVQVGVSTDWYKIFAGDTHTAAIRTAWNNDLYTAGVGTTFNTTHTGINGWSYPKRSPIQLNQTNPWSVVSVGAIHSLGVKTDGTLWAWGTNTQGQLGLNDTISRSSPVQIGTRNDWADVSSTSNNYSLALTTSGTLWAWGNTSLGQLGLNDSTNRSSPVQVGTLTWSKIRAHYTGATLAVRTDGTLWTWGPNSIGLNEIAINRSSPTQIGTETNWLAPQNQGFLTGGSPVFARKTDKSLYVFAGGEVSNAGISFHKSSPVQVTSTRNWKSVHAGTSFTIAISNNGSIWGWGDRTNGVIGDNTATPQYQESPVQIGTLTTWVSASAGNGHVLSVRTDGTMWGWGLNTTGQLGLNNTTTVSSPVQVGTLTNWKDISAGRSHTMAIKSDGTLWGWGVNITNNQLGDGTSINRSSPVQVGTLTWNVVSAGVVHSAAVRSDGTLWAWGNNAAGQLGTGNVTSVNSPVQIGTLTGWTDVAAGPSMTMAIRNGALWVWGLNSSGQLGLLRDRSRPNYVVPATQFTDIIAGLTYFIGTAPDKTLWGWGINTAGQLGLNDSTNRSSPVQLGTSTWNKISTHNSTNVAISTNGSIWSWGNSQDAVLGIFQFGPQYLSGSNVWTDTKNGYGIGGWNIFKATDNTLWGIGNNFYGNLGTGDTVSRFSPVQIGTRTWNEYSTGGLATSMAIRNDGTLWAWGVNNQGALGLGDTVGRSSPVQVGTLNTWTKVSAELHTLAIRSDGTLWAWGDGQSGELGLNLPNLQRSSPVQVGTLTDWSKVYSHQSISYAIKTDGTLWSWGLNTGGQLGLGNTVNRSSPVQLGTDTNWSSLAESDGYTNHMLAIKTDGTLWAWGQNGAGQLGLNLSTTSHRSSPVQVGTLNNWASTRVSRSNSMAIKSDGTVWAWGFNSFGELGFSDSIARSSPVQVGTLNTWASSSISRFSTLLQNNGDLYTVGVNSTDFQIYTVIRSNPIKIGSDTDWANVDVGSNHVVSIKTNGSLWVWGRNDSAGQLGFNDYVNRSSPVQLGTLTNWSNAAASLNFTVALKTDGTIWSWGLNSSGQLGIGNALDRSSPVQIGTRIWNSIAFMTGASATRHSLAVRSDGTLWSWGRGNEGQLGLAINMTIPRAVNTGVKFVDAKVGQQHGIAISTDGTLWMWGGTSFNQYSPQSITSPVQIGTRTWSKVAAQQTYSGAIRSDGTLWMWGTGTSGQLGQNSTSTFNSPVQVGTRTGWSLIKTGQLHAMAIRSDGTLWAWGSAQLGDSITVPRSSPVQIGTDTNWSYVSPGEDVTYALKSNGTLWSWGLNTSGQLGLNDLVNRSSPVQIGTDTNWYKLSDVYRHHAMAIKTDGTLWSWGADSFGALGLNTSFVNRSSPVQIGTRTDWKDSFAGYEFSMAIRNDGTLWAWGTNTNGQLGIDDTISRSSPVQVGTLNTWVSASLGLQNTVLLINDATALTTGTGTQAEGIDTSFTVNRSSPVQIGTRADWARAFVGDNISMAIRSDRTLWAWGDNATAQLGIGDAINRSSPVQIGTLTNWASASINTNNVVVLNTDNYALTMGSQVIGYDPLFAINRSSPVQLGVDTNWQKVKATAALHPTIADGGQFIAQKSDGTLWTWGANAFGNLGDGTKITRSSPVQIGNETTWVDFSAEGFHFVGIKQY